MRFTAKAFLKTTKTTSRCQSAAFPRYVHQIHPNSENTLKTPGCTYHKNLSVVDTLPDRPSMGHLLDGSGMCSMFRSPMATVHWKRSEEDMVSHGAAWSTHIDQRARCTAGRKGPLRGGVHCLKSAWKRREHHLFRNRVIRVFWAMPSTQPSLFQGFLQEQDCDRGCSRLLRGRKSLIRAPVK